MRKLILSCASLCATALICLATPASATNTRSWVSASGRDINACTQTAPCLTFSEAILQTSAGGEIDCLTGGDFGPVTIAQSITIDCGGGQVGAIGDTTSGTNAVNITAASGTVVLLNLTLNGFGTATNGILASGFNSTLLCNIAAFMGSTHSEFGFPRLVAAACWRYRIRLFTTMVRPDF